MRTFFRLLLLGLVLLLVALVSALTSMQIAIHGREVSVPNFVGKTPAEAARIAEQNGLPIEIERQYYSATIPEGRILSQVPDAGAKVRRGWQVMVAESLGPQRVQIPNAMGETERAAEINIRRRGLNINSVAEISLPGSPADRVLAQSPPPNASDISAPKISLLVSSDELSQSFVMPNFVGQPFAQVTSALKSAKLIVGKISPATADSIPSTLSPGLSAGTIVSQDPVSGQKVIEGAAVNFTVR